MVRLLSVKGSIPPTQKRLKASAVKRLLRLVVSGGRVRING